MRKWLRVIADFSVSTLGSLLIVAALASVVIDGEDTLTDFAAVSLPVLVGLGLIIGGFWLQHTLSKDRILRVLLWTLGGGIVGVAVNIWLLFIISIETAPSGNPLALTLNGASIFMAAGGIVGYYATGLQDREAELKRSESRFRALTENSSFAVITIDGTGTIRFANDAVENIFGYSPGGLEGESVTVLMPERLRDSFRDSLNRYLADGTCTLDWSGVEFTGLRANGQEFPLEVSFSDYSIEDDRIFTGVVRDVTERRQTQTQLEKHTDRITRLHEVAMGISAADSEDEIHQRTVDGAAELFPCDVARLSLIEDEMLVPTASSADESVAEYESKPMTFGYDVKTYRSGEPLIIDDLADTRSVGQEAVTSQSPSGPTIDDGDQVYRSMLSIPLGDEGILQLFATETNVFAGQDEELAELLTSHVTTSLDRIQARESMRHERNRFEEVANMLSHDLRNPLNVAQARVELLEADTNKDENIAAIKRALDRIERLIDGMLTLAQEGEAVGETEPVNLKTVAEEAWENVETASAELEFGPVDQIEADRSRILQLFENLFRNAIQHGGDDVAITVGKTNAGFFVEDSGPGIPVAERDEVFNSGYTTETEGTGFGLAIVKRIVEAHGWEIEVREASTGGARFELAGV